MVRQGLGAAVLSFVLLIGFPAGADEAAAHGHDRAVTVMTRNLYVGSDLGPVLAAPDFPAVVAAVSAIFASAQATDMPGRMEAIADEIARARPDLIGLQEAALWRTGAFTPPFRTPATTVAFDFIELLVHALAARGLHYDVAATTINLDAQLPGFTSNGLEEIRLTDRDAILVRRGGDGPLLRWSPADVVTGNFATNVTLPSPGLGAITIPRGFAAIDVIIGETAVRFLTTHLETVSAAVQVAQAQELLAGPGTTTLPLILVCDCNSSASGTGLDVTPTYDALIAAGLDDSWTDKHGRAPGFTCCQAADLQNLPSALDERIDLILLRGDVGVRHARLTGARPGDRTSGPARLWPSDHAGVTATLDLP